MYKAMTVYKVKDGNNTVRGVSPAKISERSGSYYRGCIGLMLISDNNRATGKHTIVTPVDFEQAERTVEQVYFGA